MRGIAYQGKVVVVGGGDGKLLEMARRIYGLGQVSSSEMVSV